jgi:hypothetical protein
MLLQQHTDTQLIERLEFYAEEILATGESDQYFEYVCTKYDAIQEELEARGLWNG